MYRRYEGHSQYRGCRSIMVRAASLLAACSPVAVVGCHGSQGVALKQLPSASAPSAASATGQSQIAQAANPGAQAAPGAQKQDLAASLFPHSDGTTWKLQMATQENTDKGVRDVNHDVTWTVLPTEPTDAPGSFRVETKRDNLIVEKADYLVDEEGLKYIGTEMPALAQLDPPMPLLKLPLATSGAGSAWTWVGTFKLQAGSTPATADISVSGPEDTKVPAGSYKAYKVEERLHVKASPGDAATTITLWLAPNVGLVKQAVSSPGRSFAAVLTAYKPGT